MARSADRAAAHKIPNHLEYLRNRDAAKSTEYSFDGKPFEDREELVRGLVVLFDIARIYKFGSDLDCTLTNAHTVALNEVAGSKVPGVKKGSELEKIILSKDRSRLWASDEVCYLFYRLKEDLKARTVLTTFQGVTAAVEVLRFGKMYDLFDSIYAGGSTPSADGRVKAYDNVRYEGNEVLSCTNEDKKYLALMKGLGATAESLGEMAFCSDDDETLSSNWLSGAFTFGDGKGHELPQVKHNGAVTNNAGEGGIGLTFERLKQMGVKLAREIETRGIVIDGALHNALAPIFGLPARVAVRVASDVATYVNTVSGAAAAGPEPDYVNFSAPASTGVAPTVLSDAATDPYAAVVVDPERAAARKKAQESGARAKMSEFFDSIKGLGVLSEDDTKLTFTNPYEVKGFIEGSESKNITLESVAFSRDVMTVGYKYIAGAQALVEITLEQLASYEISRGKNLFDVMVEQVKPSAVQRVARVEVAGDYDEPATEAERNTAGRSENPYSSAEESEASAALPEAIAATDAAGPHAGDKRPVLEEVILAAESAPHANANISSPASEGVVTQGAASAAPVYATVNHKGMAPAQRQAARRLAMGAAADDGEDYDISPRTADDLAAFKDRFRLVVGMPFKAIELQSLCSILLSDTQLLTFESLGSVNYLIRKEGELYSVSLIENKSMIAQYVTDISDYSILVFKNDNLEEGDDFPTALEVAKNRSPLESEDKELNQTLAALREKVSEKLSTLTPLQPTAAAAAARASSLVLGGNVVQRQNSLS